jgi:hypothetical protein
MRRMVRYQSGAPISPLDRGHFCNDCPSGAPDSMSEFYKYPLLFP